MYSSNLSSASPLHGGWLTLHPCRFTPKNSTEGWVGPGDGLDRREYLVPTGIRWSPDRAARSKSCTCYCHFQMEGFLTWHRDVPMWREQPHISYDNIPLTCFSTAQYEGGSEMTWLLTVSPWPMPALGSRKFNARLSSVTTRSRVTSVTRENTLYRRYTLRCGLSLQKRQCLSTAWTELSLRWTRTAFSVTV